MKTKLILTGLALMAATTMMNAQNANGNRQGKGQGKSSAFIDKNNDGNCDNLSANKGKSNGSSKCDGTGKGKGKRDGSGKGKNK